MPRLISKQGSNGKRQRTLTKSHEIPILQGIWMRLFCLQLEASYLQWSFFYLQLTSLAYLLTVGVFLAYSFSFFTYSWSFFVYSGKVRLIRALRDCKQRSLTVSKKSSDCISKEASPKEFRALSIPALHRAEERPLGDLQQACPVKRPRPFTHSRLFTTDGDYFRKRL